MNITKATYGGKDCTKEVQAKVKDNKLIIRSNNDIIGDPSVGVRKQLSVIIDGKEYKTEEGLLFTFPKTNNDRLGIFYSNNHNSAIYPAIRASLASLKKASEGKADVFTCMWRHEEENPFPEYIAWTQTSSHLNQLLQIMQLLYVAREIHEYKYVSFLEHDVLYAEGYFDYPDIGKGETFTNMNYIGMNKEGFQPLGQRDEPFHQMSMRFDEAISHCEKILANALVTNAGLIEPQPPYVTRKQWKALHSSIHINHGFHFTSHYNIYKKSGIYQEDEYWGKHEQFKYLFDGSK